MKNTLKLILLRAEVHLPVHQLCYDLSPLTARVTGDLYAVQVPFTLSFLYAVTSQYVFSSFYSRHSFR